jgi:hypothetical protein
MPIGSAGSAYIKVLKSAWIKDIVLQIGTIGKELSGAEDVL